MMENPRLAEENINKDVKMLFRLEKLKKETTNATIKDIQKQNIEILETFLS